jgi:hypothetical protein
LNLFLQIENFYRNLYLSCSVQCYSTGSIRLSHKTRGDDAACVTPLTTDANVFACAWAAARSPLHHRHQGNGGKTVNTTHSADVEEICCSLERAVLRYFPRPIENADTFVFAKGDAMDATQLTLFPKRRTQPRFFEIKRGLSFVTRVL